MDIIAYGPLENLIGTWAGDKGMDIAPEPEGTEENPYHETITYEATGTVKNARKQELSILRYHQVVIEKSTEEQFHDEIGYITWDPATKTVAQSFTIPRHVAVVAGGEVADGGPIMLSAALDDPDWTIAQAPFMRDNAKTTAFSRVLSVEGDTLTYSQTMTLDIYGREFEHTDGNTLSRVDN